MVFGSQRARQRTMLRVTLAVTGGLHLLMTVLCCMPWGAVQGLCRALGTAPLLESQTTILLLRWAAALTAWVGFTTLLPVVNPRKYTGVIDVSIGMLVVLSLAAALLGWHVNAPPPLYLTAAIVYGLLAALLGALRGAASYRAY
jgi:hypothetical protein